MVDDVTSPQALPARTGVAALASWSVASASERAAALAGLRADPPDAAAVAVAYRSDRVLRIDNAGPDVWSPLSGFFRAADGWIRTHGNYPHHARALLAAFGLRYGDEGALARAISRTRARAAVSAITARGGVAAHVVPEHPDLDATLRARGVVAVRRSTPAAPRTGLGGSPAAPLAGLRVLDLTRVIAGPVATRTLALLGADVLRIDPPQLPEPTWQHLDTGHGKRSALVDLRTSAGRTRVEALLRTADVLVCGYRPSALSALGLSPAAVAERHPGIIAASLSAWGEDRPQGRGFDSVVQAATGIALIESPDGARPGALPAQALDHSAGYLLAAGIMQALARQRSEGASWLVSTSLRAVAAELLGLPRSSTPGKRVEIDPAPHLQEFEVGGRHLVTAAPPLRYPGAPLRYARPRPFGADEPSWT